MPPPIIPQPASHGPSAPPASAAMPPCTQMRRCGSDTLWMSGLALVFESSIVEKSLAIVVSSESGVNRSECALRS